MKRIGNGIVIALLIALGGCGSLLPAQPAPPATYALEAQFRPAAAPPPGAPTLLVARPRESAGFDSARMAYVKRLHELDYFSRNQWIDTPGRMLAPLLLQALEASGAFRAVTLAPGPVTGQLRLETDILRLQQEFLGTPSRVRFTLRAQLIDVPGKRVIATREFDILEDAPSDDPYGGVLAANRAVQRALDETAAFCAAHSGMVRQ